MKTFSTKFLGLVVSAVLLASCSQMATFEEEDLLAQRTEKDQAGFKINPYGTNGENYAILVGGGDCNEDCIDEESGDEFAATAESPTESWGGRDNDNDSKTLSVKVWNTLTTIEYEFTINTTANNAGNLQYFDETINPETNEAFGWVAADGGGSLDNNVPYLVSRPLPDGWSACEVITEQWLSLIHI